VARAQQILERLRPNINNVESMLDVYMDAVDGAIPAYTRKWKEGKREGLPSVFQSGAVSRVPANRSISMRWSGAKVCAALVKALITPNLFGSGSAT
jgi:hypothetical protein